MDRRVFLVLAASLTGLGLASPFPARALPNTGPRRFKLFNAHTGESFDGPYRDDHGAIATAMEELSLLLRDHHSGEQIAIDVGVLDFLAAVMDGVGAGHATVLSAYRTVATNRTLARTTFGVADNSQHLYGRALDIRFESRLEEAMPRRGRCGAAASAGIRAPALSISTPAGAQLDPRRGGFEGCCRGSSSCYRAGLPEHIIGNRPHYPLGVRDRLALQHAIARAEFLARHRQ